MTSSFDPTPRPALRKASDANVHPTMSVGLSPTASAGDAVLTGKHVEVTIRIPKKLRKQLKKAADASNLTVDQIATIALANEVQRRGD